MQFTELSEAFVLKRLGLGSADMESNPTGQRQLNMIILKLTGIHSTKQTRNLEMSWEYFSKKSRQDQVSLSSKTKLSFTLYGELNMSYLYSALHFVF